MFANSISGAVEEAGRSISSIPKVIDTGPSGSDISSSGGNDAVCSGVVAFEIDAVSGRAAEAGIGIGSDETSSAGAGSVTGDSVTEATGAGEGAGGSGTGFGAGGGALVTEVGGVEAAAAGGGTAMAGAVDTRAGAPGGGLKTIRDRCGVIGSIPGGGFSMILPLEDCVLGINKRGTVAIGSISSSTPRLTETPSDVWALGVEGARTVATAIAQAVAVPRKMVSAKDHDSGMQLGPCLKT